MASLFKRTYTKRDPKSGERIKRKVRKWYGEYRDADGINQRVPLCADKTAARAMLNELVRKAERKLAGLVDPYEEHRKRPLVDHLDDYHRFLLGKGDSEEHARQTVGRTRRLLRGCDIARIPDFDATRVVEWLAAQRSSQPRFSIQTSNYYQEAVKSFARWLKVNKRMAKSPFGHLKSLNVETDRRHDRRALTTDEFAKLIESAYQGPPVEVVAGPERAMIYIVAAWTGYRRKELASLTLRSFQFDVDPPILRVQAGYSKRRRLDGIPLHAVVVERFNEWLATKGDVDSDEPLFALHTDGGKLRKTSKMMRRDLERVGIPYVDEDGLYADFHANRHTFIFNLGRADVSPNIAQTLARHSDYNLTSKVYTHSSLHDQASAVGELPPPPPMAPAQHKQDTVRATGTDDARPQKLAGGLAGTDALSCPDLAVGDNAGSSGPDLEHERNPHHVNTFDRSRHPVSSSDQVRLAGFEPATYGLGIRCSIP